MELSTADPAQAWELDSIHSSSDSDQSSHSDDSDSYSTDDEPEIDVFVSHSRRFLENSRAGGNKTTIMACLMQLDSALSVRHELRLESKDLDDCISIREELLSPSYTTLMPEDTRIGVLCGLAKHLHLRAIDLHAEFLARADIQCLEGCKADLDYCISLEPQSNIDAVTEDQHDLLRGVYVALQTLYEFFNEAGDLEHSIEGLKKLLQDPSPDDESLAVTRIQLARALRLQSKIVHSSQDTMRESYGLMMQALPPLSEGSIHYASCLAAAADITLDMFSITAKTEDLERAMEMYRELLEICPEGDARYSYIMVQYGTGLHLEYEQHFRPRALQESIYYLRKGLRLMHDLDPNRPGGAVSLAISLRDRFSITSQLNDLDEVISLFDQARNAFALERGVHSRIRCLINLAIALNIRGDYLEEPSDLRHSIGFYREALEICPDTQIDRYSIMTGLAACLHQYHNLCDSPEDLTAASEAFSELMSLQSDHPVERALALCSYAQSQSSTDDAISCIHEALGCLPPAHEQRARIISNLAKHYYRRFEDRGDQSDILEAIRYARESFALKPSIASETLAWVYLAPSSLEFDLLSGLKYMLQTVLDRDLSAQERVKTSLQLLQYTVISDPRQCTSGLEAELLLDIYQNVLGLLPYVAHLGLSVPSRLESLKSSEFLPTQAALRAIQLSHVELAIELLEMGRALFWAQALRLRAPLESLPLELASEMKAISTQLEVGSHQTSIFTASRRTGFVDEETARRRRLADRFDILVNKARNLTSSDFMRGKSFASLAKAASHGPVVILLADDHTSQAIVMPSSTAAPLQVLLQTNASTLSGWGRSLHGKDHEESASRLGLAKGNESQVSPEKILSRLWHIVVKPVLDALRLQKATGKQRPRLWWCPTSSYSHLPLHAAGVYDKDRHISETVSEYVVSSYTPTVEALSNARSGPRDEAILVKYKAGSTLLVAVAQSDLPNFAPIMSTISEIDCLKQIIPKECLIDPTSIGNSSTMHIVKEALQQAKVVHFACHGVQDKKDPLQSGLILQDKRMTLSELMKYDLSAHGVFFAYLSACESAMGDESQPNQSIHLASAMLFVGFRSVVATMWSMYDKDGPEVAKTVYEAIYANEAVDPNEIPYALDAAVQRLQGRGLSPARWAPYMHWGM